MKILLVIIGCLLIHGGVFGFIMNLVNDKYDRKKKTVLSILYLFICFIALSCCRIYTLI